MIDVTRELEKYEEIDMESENDVCCDNEISQLLNIFNKTVERIGKEQYKSLRYLGEISEALEEDKGGEELLKNISEKLIVVESEKKSLLVALIEIGDLFEDMYVFSQKNSNQSFSSQIGLEWGNIKQSMLKCGLTRFGDVGEAFNRYFHIPKEVKETQGNLENNCILGIIKSGYAYKGDVVRKAEVVING